MNGARCNWPRGKVIGGSSVLNYMLYLRGHKKDYDDWEAMGNSGWNFKEASAQIFVSQYTKLTMLK